MKISRNRLVELINEELERDEKQQVQEYTYQPAMPIRTPERDMGPGLQQDLLGLMNVETGDPDAVYNNCKIAVRILEEIPYEYVENEYAMELIKDAHEALIDVLDDYSEKAERDEDIKKLRREE
tara:strand:+ start:1471 stop:1842 length:372 start_codon:yes stop_codon:yes gene_type:complete